MSLTAVAVPEEFAAVLAALSESCQRAISDAQARLYYATVSEYSDDAIRHGVMELIKTRLPGGGRPVLPLPAEVRAAVAAHVKANTDTRMLPGRVGDCGTCNDGLVKFADGIYTMHRPCVCPAGEKWRPHAEAADAARRARQTA